MTQIDRSHRDGVILTKYFPPNSFSAKRPLLHELRTQKVLSIIEILQ
jgi:hypothetical protein